MAPSFAFADEVAVESDSFTASAVESDQDFDDEFDGGDEGSESAPEDDFGFEEDWDAAFDDGESGAASTPAFTWRFESAFENIINTDRELHFEDDW